MATFKLSIYTPNVVVADGIECDSLQVPTTTGEIGILPEHIQLVTHLDTGIMTVKSGDTNRLFSVTSGTLRVHGDKIVIMTTAIEKQEGIDSDRAKIAKEKAEEKLRSDLSDEDRVKYTRKIDRAEIRLKLALMRKAK